MHKLRRLAGGYG